MDDPRIEGLARQAGQAVRERADELAQRRPPAETIGRRSRTRRDVLVGIVGLLAVVGVVAVIGGTSADAPFIDEPPAGVPGLTEASQSAEEAARDGVPPEVAALPFDVRVNVRPPTFAGASTRIVSDEGVWVVSGVERPGDYAGDPLVGDPDGVYGRDFVHLPVYAEILLLDPSEARILRAFPLSPYPAAGGLEADDDAVYCHRAADGAEPDSMLCRIDRSTYDWIVRIFPQPSRSSFSEPDAYIPEHWIINEPLDGSLTGVLSIGQDNLRLIGVQETVIIDRTTLELVTRDGHDVGGEPVVVDGVRVLAKIPGWSHRLGRMGSPFAVMEIAYDEETARQAWQDNVPGSLPATEGIPYDPGIYGGLDDVDFETQAVVVWSSGQSGSCPAWVRDIRTDRATVEVEVKDTGHLRPSSVEMDGQTVYIVCTRDYNPYRMILAVDRDRLPDPADLPLRDINGVPDGLATKYPAA